MRNLFRRIVGMVALMAAFAGLVFAVLSALAASSPKWYELFEKLLSPAVLVGVVLCEIWFGVLIIGSILIQLGIWRPKSES